MKNLQNSEKVPNYAPRFRSDSPGVRLALEKGTDLFLTFLVVVRFSLLSCSCFFPAVSPTRTSTSPRPPVMQWQGKSQRPWTLQRMTKPLTRGNDGGSIARMVTGLEVGILPCTVKISGSPLIARESCASGRNNVAKPHGIGYQRNTYRSR